MRFAIATTLTLVSIFVASQQNPQRTPRTNFPPGYFYLPSPFISSWGYQNLHPVPYSYGNIISPDSVITNEEPEGVEIKDKQNVHSRVKGVSVEEPTDKAIDKPGSRLFNSVGFVNNPYNYNPFQKTYYRFTSTTATLFTVTTCIPAAQFSNAAAQASICVGRKRREDREILAMIDDLTDEIAPSNVQQMTSSVSPELRSDKSLSNQKQNPVGSISSSKEEPLDSDSDSKRSARNIFGYTSVITVYSFTTTTFSSTLAPAATSVLTCRPANVGIC